METLGDAFPKEQARIRECVLNAIGLGNAGAFYRMVGEDLLKRADIIVMSGDLAGMIEIFKEMKEFKS